MIAIWISIFLILFIKKIWITISNMDNLAHFLGKSVEATFKHFEAAGLSVTNMPGKQRFIHLDVMKTSFYKHQNFKVGCLSQVLSQAPTVSV